MNKLLSSTLQQGYTYILNKYKPSHNVSIQLLDPLSIIIKLGIISLKPVGTKIAIFNNQLHVQDPTFLQGPIRWTYGVTREDIHLLFNPITKAIHNYSPYFDDSYKPLFLLAIKGLEVLKQSYFNQSSILSHALEYYIFIIKNSFDSNNNDLDSLVNNNMNQSLENIFSNVWTKEDINVIVNMFNIASSNIVNTHDYIIAINAILSTKQKLVKDIIHTTTQMI